MILYIILVKLIVFLVFCAWLNRRNIKYSQKVSPNDQAEPTPENVVQLSKNIASIKQSQKLAVGFKDQDAIKRSVND